MSCSVRALRTMSFCPRRAAAACMTAVSGRAFELSGFTRKAIMVAAGTSSRNSSRRFATSRDVNRLTPVILPPGRLTLATNPTSTGSLPIMKTIGIVAVAALTANTGGFPPVARNRSHLTTSQVGRHHGQSFVVILRPAECDLHVLALDVARLGQTLAECNHSLGFVGRPTADESNHRHRRLLRPRRERPRGTCAAEQRDELATAAHSITSSARSRNDSGIVRPSA